MAFSTLLFRTRIYNILNRISELLVLQSSRLNAFSREAILKNLMHGEIVLVRKFQVVDPQLYGESTPSPMLFHMIL